jgi:dihydropyrimidinase
MLMGISNIFCSGQAAALAGGTTFHIDFALPVEGSLIKGLKEWHRKAADSVMDYGFHMAVTSWSDQASSASS